LKSILFTFGTKKKPWQSLRKNTLAQNSFGKRYLGTKKFFGTKKESALPQKRKWTENQVGKFKEPAKMLANDYFHQRGEIRLDEHGNAEKKSSVDFMKSRSVQTDGMGSADLIAASCAPIIARLDQLERLLADGEKERENYQAAAEKQRENDRAAAEQEFENNHMAAEKRFNFLRRSTKANWRLPSRSALTI
jgi:hypothetical protein